jgi:hypothetical protein
VRYRIACGLRLLARVAEQSSGHFPVAGVVIQGGKSYAFRDGLVAIVPGVQNGTRLELTPQQVEAAMTSAPSGWGRYARLEGTTYEQYTRYGRMTDVNGKLIDESAMTFPELAGARYRSAWGRSYNTLMRAWACANVQYLKSKMTCVPLPDGVAGAARSAP